MKTSMSRSTFKILFYVKKGSERANGYLPLMCRLTVDGEIKQFSCKLDVPPKLWDVKTARATGKSAEAQKINAEVDRIRVDVNRRYQAEGRLPRAGRETRDAVETLRAAQRGVHQESGTQPRAGNIQPLPYHIQAPLRVRPESVPP